MRFSGDFISLCLSGGKTAGERTARQFRCLEFIRCCSSVAFQEDFRKIVFISSYCIFSRLKSRDFFVLYFVFPNSHLAVKIRADGKSSYINNSFKS